MTTWNNVKLVVWMLIVGCAWAFVSAMSVYQWDVFNMGSDAWKAVVVAILTQCGSVITLYLAPWFRQFGFGRQEVKP